MSGALKKLLFAILQLPLAGGLAQWWSEAQNHPIVAALIAVLYEFSLLGLAFGKKIWKKVSKEIEEDLVNSISDWILAAWHGFSLRFRGRYNRQVIIEHGFFNVTGLDLVNTFTLKLEQVFVPLRIVPSSHPQSPNVSPIPAKIKIFEDNRLIWNFLRAGKHKLADAIGLAIVGPPGSGKTTLLQHMALTLAANRQRRYRCRAYLPVLLFLRNHVQAITKEKAPPLGSVAQDYFNNSELFPKLKPPPNWFERKLTQGKCIILLDGLDEVGDLKQREKVSAWVDEQIKNYSRCRFVLTSRPHGYNTAPLKHAHILEVQHFSPEQVQEFVKNWYLANEITSVGGKKDAAIVQKATRGAKDLLDRLRRFPALNELTVNPLLLTMIAMVHRYRGSLPGSRVQLYKEICEVLLERWRRSRGVQDDTLTAQQKRRILQPLAAHMMRRKIRDISTQDAMEMITQPLKRVGVTDEATKTFLRDLQASSGLLLEREANTWSFAHKTFQEYLTAEYELGQDPDKHDWKELVSDDWWHETLRLYAAQADATPIVQACLDIDSVETLTLAAECLDEASELDPELRKVTIKRLEAGLESSDPKQFHLAAEVQLSRRLKSFHRIDDEREISLEYQTCAEYQLFLDDMREQGKYYQLDHWTDYRFQSGQAKEPVSGVRAKDADAFCGWLNQKRGGGAVYRLPTPDEARQYPANQYPARQMALAAWCRDEAKISLVGLAEIAEQNIRQQLAEVSSSELPPPPSLHLLDLALDLAFARDRALARALDLAFARDLAFALARDLAFALARDLAFALTRVLARARDRDLDLARARDLARDLTRVLALDRTSTYGEFTTIADRIEKRDFHEAHRLAQELQTALNDADTRIATLLRDLLAIVIADTNAATWHALRKLAARILEYTYIGYEILGREDRPWWRRLFHSSRNFAYEAERKMVLELYWWLQVVMAREAGTLPAWEGIRIVRERLKADV